jgi:HK97 family phage major capsid protein
LFRAVAQLSDHERNHYSVARLLRAAIERADGARVASRPDMSRTLQLARLGATEKQVVERGQESATCLEEEISNAIAAEIGVPEHGGFYLPMRLQAVGLDTKTDAAGKFTIAAGAAGTEIIDALTAQSKVLSLGAMLVSGLRGGEQFPSELNTTVASFVQENTGVDVGESDESFTGISLSPRMTTATTSYSRRLLDTANVSGGLENWLRAKLVRAHSLCIDKYSVQAGTATTTTGILGTSGVNAVVMGTNGGVITAPKIYEMIAAVGNSNADWPSNGFLSTPAIKSVLSQTARFTGSGLNLWDGFTCAGYRAEVSSNVPSDLTKGTSSGASACHAVIFGAWDSLMIGEFGALEITLDPFTKKKQGEIEITSYQTIAVAVRHPAAFAVILDAKTS